MDYSLQEQHLFVSSNKLQEMFLKGILASKQTVSHLFHPPFSSLSSFSARILHLRSYLSCAWSCSIFMRRLTVSVLMPGLGAMSSSNSIASCCKRREHADTTPTCGDVNKQPLLFCHTWSNRDSLPHCWDKESSWTPRPACTYPPVDHSQTPLCRSQF